MEGTYQAELGTNLIIALGAGQGWLTDDTNLNRLLQLSVTSEQRQQVEQLFGAWKQQPKQIQFIPFGKGEVQIAQYHAKSVATATEKLKQFPRGTEFVWTGTLTQPSERKSYEELSSAVQSSGIRIRLSSAPN